MNYEYPLALTFKITTLSSDFNVVDAHNRSIFYVRQKMFKLREEVKIFKDDTQSQALYTIKANQWLDFSAAYNFTNAEGQALGKIARKGLVSIFKAHYDIYDNNDKLSHTVREENPWVKVFDALIDFIPFLGLLSGYLFHPAYIVTDKTGKAIARLVKKPSLIGRRFELEKLANFQSETEEESVLLGLSMLLLLESDRG
jgi:uncharacterized protein YxjI